MGAVKNGLHVQLGVSRLRNTKTALFLARLEKEKPFCQSLLLLELRCMILY